MDPDKALVADTSRLSIAANEHEPSPSQEHKSSVNLSLPSKSSLMARDVTEDFNRAASALRTGQLVQDDFFTLFEAVGALEIMDPKMDSGYLREGETLDHEYDILRELLPEEVVGIMDQMFCFEMAWHMGYPLSQSLFTSIYIDRLLSPEPKTLDDARFKRDRTPTRENELLHTVLRAFCLGLIKTCDFVHCRINTERFYEEEDFVSNLYNRSLLSNYDVADITRLLDEAISYVHGHSNAKFEASKPVLLNRLELRKTLLAAVTLDGIVDPQKAALWEQCLKLIPLLLQSKDFGVPVPESFNIKIQRKLASTVPPRPMVENKLVDAIRFFESLCQSGRDAYKILNYRGGSNLQTFVWWFNSRDPQPSVYSRSLLQSLTWCEMRVLGNMSIKQLIFNDVEEIVLPADILVDSTNSDVEAPHDPRFQIARGMDDLVTRTADAFLDIFVTLSMNRSRLRRMLCHILVEWDNIQLDTEQYDIAIRSFTGEKPLKGDNGSDEEIWSFPLSSWAYYQKLRQMEWIMQMGFELNIYQVDELAGMYWYLQHLASTRLQHLERIRTFTARRLSKITNPTLEQKSSAYRSKTFTDFATLEASAIQSFADGLSCLYSFLSHLSLIPHPYHSQPYSTPSLRYTNRMRPFLPISLPQVPTFPEFTSLVSLRTPTTPTPPSARDLNAQAYSILEVADQALKVARKEWEAVSKTDPETARCVGCEEWWRDGVRNVLRACIMANIAVVTAKKAVRGADGVPAGERLLVELGKGKGYSAWWVVPKISAK